MASEVDAELLGLETQDAYRLFDDENSMDSLWRIADELTDGEVSRILTGDEPESA